MSDVKQILVVEDDPAIAEMLVEFLSDEGYQVVHFDHALEALKALSDRMFHLVTLDLGLPDIDGNEFLHQLSQTTNAVPVVVVSANPQQLKPNPLVKAVVPKPFDLHRLSNAIEQHLD
jgi:DNA-binding response OmpR family regulator